MDVTIAFLYGDVEEEIYMEPPDAFEDQANPTKKHRRVRALTKRHASGTTS